MSIYRTRVEARCVLFANKGVKFTNVHALPLCIHNGELIYHPSSPYLEGNPGYLPLLGLPIPAFLCGPRDRTWLAWVRYATLTAQERAWDLVACLIRPWSASWDNFECHFHNEAFDGN